MQITFAFNLIAMDRGRILLTEEGTNMDDADHLTCWKTITGRRKENETEPEAIARKLAEDTGMALDDACQDPYELQYTTVKRSPQGDFMIIGKTFVCTLDQSLQPKPKDNRIIQAEWVPHREALMRLRDSADRALTEPLLNYLLNGRDLEKRWIYEKHGALYRRIAPESLQPNVMRLLTADLR
jgi:ADP-ribose pyrophosphatase YjhB (NUDIX family)